MNLSGIFMSDGIAKDGTRFDLKALEDSLWISCQNGVPSHLDHDIHRLVGWSRPTNLVIGASQAVIMGHTFIPETDEEINEVVKMQNAHINNLMIKRIKENIDPFSKLLSEHGLINSNQANIFADNIVMFGYKDIVLKAFPFFEETDFIDKSELVSVNKLLAHFNYIGQGVFKDKKSDLAIIVHPYFRRSLSIYNSLNLDVLEELSKLFDKKDIEVRLHIDLDTLCYAPSFVKQHEYDWWYGPKYTDDIEHLPLNVVTKYSTPDLEKNFTGYSFTDFWWKSNKNEPETRELEAEEVRSEDAPALDGTHFPCRYIHSIYDTEQQLFVHFDCAIRDYNKDDIIERQQYDISKTGKDKKYTKLFRLDGKIPLAKWKSIITMFFRENSSVYEYFGMRDSADAALNNNVSSTHMESPDKMSILVPHATKQGDGVFLSVNYSNRRSSTQTAFVIEDTFTISECDKVTYANTFTLDLCKLIRRNGVDISLPSEILFLECGDGYQCIPLIEIADNNCQSQLDSIFAAIKMMVETLAKGRSKVLTFSLSWNMEDHNVTLSFAGDAYDLSQWMKSVGQIPIEHLQFRDWLNVQYKYIKSHGTTNTSLRNTLCSDGVFFIKKRNIECDVNPVFPETYGDFINDDISFDIKEDQQYIRDLVNDGKLTCRKLILTSGLEELASGMDYMSTDNIALLGETQAALKDIKFFIYVWSDR